MCLNVNVTSLSRIQTAASLLEIVVCLNLDDFKTNRRPHGLNEILKFKNSQVTIGIRKLPNQKNSNFMRMFCLTLGFILIARFQAQQQKELKDISKCSI